MKKGTENTGSQSLFMIIHYSLRFPFEIAFSAQAKDFEKRIRIQLFICLFRKNQVRLTKYPNKHFMIKLSAFGNQQIIFVTQNDES